MTTADAIESIAYVRQGTAELSLDLFWPGDGGNGTAVLIFHGGGWRAGAKELVHERAAALAAAGFTAAAVQYRLLDAAPWPAPLADASAALAWVRDNASKLQVDPAKVVVQGHSAGGHIALMTGTLGGAERPAAIVAYYPAVGFHRAPRPVAAAGGADPVPPLPLPVDELGRIPDWMLFPPGVSQADLDAASPITLADATFPPVLLFHGTADSAIPFPASASLHGRLIELGVPSELHVYADRDHEFDMAPSMRQATVAVTTSFLQRLVVRPDESAAEARRYAFPPSTEAPG